MGFMVSSPTEPDVWIGDSGMKLTERGSDLFVSARFCRQTGNLDQFLSQLRNAILLWCAQHPYQRTRGGTGTLRRSAGAVKSVGRWTPLRLPETIEERQALDVLALKGPAEVYKWVYGPENLLCQAIEGMTWKDFGADNPSEGCLRLIESIRAQFQDLLALRPTLRRPKR
jgi:hypothetical protein